MKTLTLLIALTLSANTFGSGGHDHGSSHSHGGHTHSHKVKEVSKEQATKNAKENIERLISSKKIDSSWKNSKLDSSVKKKFNGKTEWLLTFSNEEGKKGKKLYIFLTLSGDFVAANFTGK